MHKTTPLLLLLPLTLTLTLTLSLPQAPTLPTPPTLTPILPLNLQHTLEPLLTTDLALVLEAVLAGVSATLLENPLVEALAEFLHGAGEGVVCTVDPGVCEVLGRWCLGGSNTGEDRSVDEDVGESGIPPPTRDSLMNILSGGESETDPMTYLNQWLKDQHSPSSSLSPSMIMSPSSTQLQPLKSWIEKQSSQYQSPQGQSVDPDILSSLRLCALGGVAEVLSQGARGVLMSWLESEGGCPLEEGLRGVVVGWVGGDESVEGVDGVVGATGVGRPRGSGWGVVGGKGVGGWRA